MGKGNTDLENLPVLVTGGGGFIGSHLARRLVELGAKVSVLIRPDSAAWRIRDIWDQISSFQVDITQPSEAYELINAIQPRKIYHLAAFVNPQRSLDLLETMIEVNLIGTINLLKALADIEIDCFISTGTCEEYGDGPVPFKEEQREKAISPYAASKVASTYICQLFSRLQDIPIVIVRPAVVYGPYQSEETFIGSVITACLKGQVPSTTPGEQTRDFVYVDDIIEGYIRASLIKQAAGQIINLGTGVEYQLKQVVALITQLTKTRVAPNIGALPYRSGEIMQYYCSNRKAKEVLGWEPRVSLEEGLRRTIQWYKQKPSFQGGN